MKGGGSNKRIKACLAVPFLRGRTFIRPNHHSYTFTHLVDVLTQFTNFHNFSQGNMYPVYLTGDVPPPIAQESTWFTLTTATPTLKQHLFPNFFDSEMGSQYTLTEEPRDPEHT